MNFEKVFDVNKNERLKRHYVNKYGLTIIW
jgi:hypothetical protein